MNGLSMPMHEKRELPMVTFREIDLPEIANWEVNGQYYLIIKTKMVGKSQPYSEDKNDSKKLEGTFKILSVRALDKKPAEEIERREYEELYAKMLNA